MLSKRLAEFIESVRFESLPPNTVRMAKLAFLDWLGSAARGGRERPAKMALAVLQAQGGSPQATLVPSGTKTSALNASLANGIASHIMELDDVHRGSIVHAAAAVIPAALAAAEMAHADGKKLVEAVTVGYEAAIRLGEAVTPSHYYYFHNTGTCGTFGACAAAGKVFGLTVEQMVWALGNAGTQAAGLWEFLASGAMSKHLHPGKAAYNGLLAVLLAREGFTGAPEIIEGEKGFCRAMAPEFDLSRITDGLGGAHYKVEENSFKIHSSCRHTHPSVDLVLELAAEYAIRPEDVDTVTVRTYLTALEITRNPAPETVYAAKFSLPYCVALALSRGSCGLGDFSEENLRDPVIRSVMSRVRLETDDAIEAAHPAKWGGYVEITTRAGQAYSAKIDFPRGDPENPAAEEELAAKFRRMARDAWREEKVEALAESVMKLEELEDVALLLHP